MLDALPLTLTLNLTLTLTLTLTHTHHSVFGDVGCAATVAREAPVGAVPNPDPNPDPDPDPDPNPGPDPDLNPYTPQCLWGC